MINAVTQGITFDFLMNGEGAILFVVMQLHLWSVKTGFTFYKIANSGIFYDHLGPKGVSWKTKKIIALIGCDFNDNIGPSGEDMFKFLDFLTHPVDISQSTLLLLLYGRALHQSDPSCGTVPIYRADNPKHKRQRHTGVLF